MRRPLLSAAGDPAIHDDEIVDGEDVEEDVAGPAIAGDDLDVAATPSSDGPADAGADDVAGDGPAGNGDEIAEITRVVGATPPGDDRDGTPRREARVDEDGEPTQQYSAINPRETAAPDR